MNEDIISGLSGLNLGDAILNATDEQLDRVYDQRIAAVGGLGTDLGKAIVAEKKVVKTVIPIARKKADFSALKPLENKDTTWKEFLKNRTYLLSPEIKQGLNGGRLKFIPHELYFVKYSANMNLIEMITSNDKLQVGISNLANGMLPSNQPFLLTHVGLVTGVSAMDPGIDDTAAKAVTFGTAGDYVLNGDFDMEVAGEKLFDSHSCLGFKNASAERLGLLELGDPRIIAPQTTIKFNVKPSVFLAAKTFAKLILKGSIAYRY